MANSIISFYDINKKYYKEYSKLLMNKSKFKFFIEFFTGMEEEIIINIKNNTNET